MAAPLGGRAFEILEVLSQAQGELVTKDELLDRVWGTAAVSENLLQVHISAVRKALGSYRSLLKTQSGRGYRLLGDWGIELEPAPQPSAARTRHAQEPPAETRSNLPVLITDLIGRDAALPHVCGLLSAYRIVTLSGAGGIGKTTLALHAARGLLSDYAGGAWFVELAPLSDPSLVPSTVASALGLKLGDANSTEAVARSIATTRLLLVLDNCEHVIDAVASLAETLVRLCPRLTILATSREVLRIGGEYIYRVPPLEVPEVEQFGVDDLRSHSAVALFIARTEVLDPIVPPRSDNLPTIASICRHLDGMPLAIEFAAARAATLGIEAVHAELRNRFALLTTGRRTAVPRHKTLRATLDWSYELLPAEERALLRRLSVLSGSFGLQAAEALIGGGRDGGEPAVAERIANLVDKSLIVPDRIDAGRWRLLETTRAYAAEKLAESGEAGEVARRHAEFFLEVFAPFGTESRLQAAIDELPLYRREIDNLRGALTWAFSDTGDGAIGVRLAATSCDFWIAESLIAECRDWSGRALDQLGGAAGSRDEMVLQCARGRTLLYTRGMIGESLAALEAGLRLAEALDDADFQQRASMDVWLFRSRSALLGEALDTARRLEELTRDREIQFKAAADWIVGISLTYLAAHDEAATRLRHAIEIYPVERREKDLIRLGSDLRASAAGHLTVNLVSLGELDDAGQSAMRAIAEARVTKHATALCIALVWAGFTFISLGDLNRSEQIAEELVEHAYKHGMIPFHAAGLCIRGSVLARRGEPAAAIAPLRTGLAGMQQASYLLFYPFFLVELAQALLANDRLDDALAEIDKALETATRIDYRWLIPEIKRNKAEILLQRDPESTGEAEQLLSEALSQARAQGATYWEFCASLSSAELLSGRGDVAEAHALLTPLCDRLSTSSTISALPAIRRAAQLLAG
ncbi:winged helix-turn-helix domain-containing protein [Bosea sp. BK604]|uniref:ATP-binding protein n=1 Tax=Bosea sp. BK604 TaxID=2512180 RepID=UPI001053A91E|nr:winged helix-turn-helix domain-containing protein [Bosea sp. BK604]TCR63021.1 non-specific serine/threonine protein kinase [Bosea sp. BK604]